MSVEAINPGAEVILFPHERAGEAEADLPRHLIGLASPDAAVTTYLGVTREQMDAMTDEELIVFRKGLHVTIGRLSVRLAEISKQYNEATCLVLQAGEVINYRDGIDSYALACELQAEATLSDDD